MSITQVPAIIILPQSRMNDPDYEGQRTHYEQPLRPRQECILYTPSVLEQLLIEEGRFIEGQSLIMEEIFGSRQIVGGTYRTVLSAGTQSLGNRYMMMLPTETQNAQQIMNALDALRLESFVVSDPTCELSVEYFPIESRYVSSSAECSGMLYALRIRNRGEGRRVNEEQSTDNITVSDTVVRAALRTVPPC